MVDAHDTVLLFRAVLSDREPWWFAPGGGLEPGETYEQAVVRELLEETGLAVDVEHVGRPVWKRRTIFQWKHVPELHDERFFFIRIPSHEVDTRGMPVDERDVIREHRWWPIEEIGRSTERFAPARMVALLEPLVRGDLPAQMIDAGE